jgi:hypothetical protein
MPLIWERAFGGRHIQGDAVISEDRNPVGIGFAPLSPATDSKEQPRPNLEGQPLPNLENLEEPLKQPGDSPTPACLAPIAPAWLPRRAFAGTYDEEWQRGRAPYLPDDFDPRFFQCAAPEFVFDRYLTGGESVDVAGVSPEGPIAFTVPDSRLIVEVTVAGTSHHPRLDLETVSIEPDDNRVCLTWRATLPCNRQALRVQRIVVSRHTA